MRTPESLQAELLESQKIRRRQQHRIVELENTLAEVRGDKNYKKKAVLTEKGLEYPTEAPVQATEIEIKYEQMRALAKYAFKATFREDSINVDMWAENLAKATCDTLDEGTRMIDPFENPK